MKEYTADFSIKYKGQETITKTVKAESERAALAMFEDMDIDDDIAFWNAEIECLSIEVSEVVYRCRETEDMFA